MENDYYTNVLNKFSGSVIEQAISDPEGEFFGLKIKTPLGKHKIIWFLMDDEGNGPGSFEIQEVKG
jgi:hypothetical protein